MIAKAWPFWILPLKNIKDWEKEKQFLQWNQVEDQQQNIKLAVQVLLMWGQKIPIKVAAQAVPAYTMSVFTIPMGICNDIQRTIANFWWGSKSDKRSVHWSR